MVGWGVNRHGEDGATVGIETASMEFMASSILQHGDVPEAFKRIDLRIVAHARWA